MKITYINMMGVMRGMGTFRMVMGRLAGDDKTGVREEGAIRDDSAGGSTLVCRRRV